MMPLFSGEKQILFKVLLDILKNKNQAKTCLLVIIVVINN